MKTATNDGSKMYLYYEICAKRRKHNKTSIVRCYEFPLSPHDASNFQSVQYREAEKKDYFKSQFQKAIYKTIELYM